MTRTDDRTPAYNLKVVLQITGIKPDTLRAWERRYGLPQPERTAGGHRLYSHHDIEMIRWLMARQEEGMRIHQAIELWRSMEEGGRDPLAETSPLLAEDVPERPAIVSGVHLDEMRHAWVAACMNYDEPGAERILAQAFALYPLESVCLEVLQVGLREIGDLWFNGKLTVQQEHFASSLALRRLDALLTAAPPPTRPDRVVVGCPPDEEHVFSPLLAALFLRYRGWDVVYLGANVPQMYLERTVRSTGASLVILTATQLKTAANLQGVAQFLQGTHTPVAYGGPIFSRLPGLRTRIPGYFLGEHLSGVVQAVENILLAPPRLQPVEMLRSDYQRTLADFRARNKHIQVQVWENLQNKPIDHHELDIANEYLCQNIIAALALGNMDFLQPELKWVEMLIQNYGLSAHFLPDYLNIFIQAVKTQMPDTGQLISEWLIAHKDEWS